MERRRSSTSTARPMSDAPVKIGKYEIIEEVGRGSMGTVYSAYDPFADRNVVLFVGTLCLGSAARYLGLVAATMRDWQRAETHFAAALVTSSADTGARAVRAIVADSDFHTAS